jgi:hypothetical protein
MKFFCDVRATHGGAKRANCGGSSAILWRIHVFVNFKQKLFISFLKYDVSSKNNAIVRRKMHLIFV